MTFNDVTFAPETRSDFAHQLILFLPPRFQCPRKDLLKMIAVVHGGVKENDVGALFRFQLVRPAGLGDHRSLVKQVEYLTHSSFSATCGHESVDGAFQE